MVLKKKKWLLIALLLGICVAFFSYRSWSYQQKVKKLEAWVEENEGFVAYDEQSWLQKLPVSVEPYLASVIGKRVVGVFVDDIGLEDIDPLKEWPELKKLDLSNTLISDLRGLSSLKKLEYLDLSRTSRLKDISPLKNLISLKELNLINSSVSDLEPLANLKQLEELSLIGSSVQDLSPLRQMKQLKAIVVGLGQFSQEEMEGLPVVLTSIH